MASVRKRGTKWHVQIRRSASPTVTRTFTLKADAEKWARAVESQIDRSGSDGYLNPRSNLTVGDLLYRYRKAVTPKKRGATSESYRLGVLLRSSLAEIRLTSLKPFMIAEYRDKRLEVVQAATIRRELSILKHCFNIAHKDWGIHIDPNPLQNITVPIVKDARSRRLEEGEFTRLLKGSQKGRTQSLESVIILAVETGMRRSELLGIRWDNISWQAHTVSIAMTKNGSPRTIPLSAKAIEILKTIPRTNERVFPLTGNSIRLAWERLKRRVGIENLRFHDLRHEAISRFFERGLSVPEVALISGHNDLRMLYRYTHLRADDIAKKL
jgi:integrase